MNRQAPGRGWAELAQRDEAGFVNGWYCHAMAVLGAVEGNDAAALHHVENALETGHANRELFAEPGLEPGA